MKNLFLSLVLILLFFTNSKAQLFESEVYNFNPWVDIPITAAAFGLNTWGLAIVDRKSPLDSLEISQLDANNINAFDRSATKQDVNTMYQAWDRSDLTMRISFFLPALLLIDKEIRNDFVPVIILYLQAEGLAGATWSWGCSIHIDRIRPLAYHPDVKFGEKTGPRVKNSFFSGHTSSSAAATFFMAKVYCDYHPELGNKKFIFYGLAAIPPAITGFYRYKGMKHFPTDVLTGMAVGAASGILVPHFHKKKDNNLTLIPVTGQYTGFAMTLKF